MGKATILFAAVLLFLLCFPLGSLSYRVQGICRDSFDLKVGKKCNDNTCKAFCKSKHFRRLYDARCVEDITCECDHDCQPSA